MLLVYSKCGRVTCGARVVQISNRSQCNVKSAPAPCQARSTGDKQRGGMHCRADNTPRTYKGRVESSPATPQRVGVLGGGQLGKMLGTAAARLGIALRVLDPTENCPAACVAEQVLGDFSDSETVRSFVAGNDVLTVEIEHVDAEAMKAVAEASGIDVQPTPETLALIQDKFRQKEHFNHIGGVKVTSYIEVTGEGTADLAGMVLGFPFMLKAKRWAYDGKGNAVVRKLADLQDAMRSLGGHQAGLYGEKWVSFTKEIAVMVARSKNGEVTSFPVTETIHKDSICYVTQTPAQIPEELRLQAQAMAEKAVSCLEGAGVFGVEMFVVEGGELLLNEVAPRPHNSGHYTIEACAVSQFEQHLRAVLGLPLGDPSLKVSSSIMLNILGEADGEEGLLAAQSLLEKAYRTPGASVHWYGKKGVTKNRKIGHITIVADTAEEAQSRLSTIDAEAAQALDRSADRFAEDWKRVTAARKEQEAAESSGGGGRPVLALSVQPPFTVEAGNSAAEQGSQQSVEQPRRMEAEAAARIVKLPVAAAVAERGPDTSLNQGHASSSGAVAEVAVIMGSDSDLPTMRAAAEALRDFDIRCEVTVVSAHRTPDRMLAFARGAHTRGIKVIIAGAGGAAHLPGMVAALTPLPVVGVPVTPKGAHLDGLDALMSIVQMPRGVPVATVAIGNAANAGLLAARILALSNPGLLERMLAYQESMRKTVLSKAERLESQGWEDH